MHSWNWCKLEAAREMTNKYPETLCNAAQPSAALLVLTLFKGSHHQRKMCDWRLLSQYYSARCMEVWTHSSLTREISVRLCEQTTFHKCRLLVNAALRLHRTGRATLVRNHHLDAQYIPTWTEHTGLLVMQAFTGHSWNDCREKELKGKAVEF